MPGQDRVEAPAVCTSPALSELSEFALRAPHLAFGQAMRRAKVDALEVAARLAAESAAHPTAGRHTVFTARREIGDV